MLCQRLWTKRGGVQYSQTAKKEDFCAYVCRALFSNQFAQNGRENHFDETMPGLD
jgi:hypothetical protein